jgi:sialate O-acetylesterase
LLSPEVVSATVNGSTVTLTLDQPLRDNGQLFEFELAGADGRFQNAEATGQGNIITVTSPVATPVRLRYAWKNNPLKANVFSLEGLPLSPFQLDLNQ